LIDINDSVETSGIRQKFESILNTDLNYGLKPDVLNLKPDSNLV
jgi:hypothetical protein